MIYILNNLFVRFLDLVVDILDIAVDILNFVVDRHEGCVLIFFQLFIERSLNCFSQSIDVSLLVGCLHEKNLRIFALSKCCDNLNEKFVPC